MDDQKKRFAYYTVLILICFTGAFLFLRIQKDPLENMPPVAPVAKDSLVTVTLVSDLLDLENSGDGFVTTEKAAGGKKSCKLSPDAEYGVNNPKMMKDIPDFQSLKKIDVTFKALFDKTNPDAVYVISIEDPNNKNVFWDSRPIYYNETAEWTEQSISLTVPAEFVKGDNRVSIYPWNRNKKTFYVDDVRLNYVGEVVYREGQTNLSEKSNAFYDFETEAGLSTADNVKESTAHSGKKVCEMTGGTEYGPIINKTLSDLGPTFPKQVSASVWVYPLADNVNLILTVSVVNSKKETIFWEGESTENKDFPKFKWTKINMLWKLPTEKFSPEDVLGVGIWNKGKTDVAVDDIEIVYGESPERRGDQSKIDPVSIYEKRFSPEKNKPPFRTIWFEKQESGNDLEAFAPGDRFITGNFNNDPKGLDEILCIGENKQILFTYDDAAKQFKKIWENKNPGDELWKKENTFLGNIRNGKTSLAIGVKSKSLGTTLIFDGTNWVAGPAEKVVAALTVTTPIQNFEGRYTANTKQTLRLDQTWRFDLKLIQNNEILGAVDFKGYPADHNPKYYEFVTLVPGHFTSSERHGLLVFMANCADTEFDGKKCNALENLPFLPNTTQLYSFRG